MDLSHSPQHLSDVAHRTRSEANCGPRRRIVRGGRVGSLSGRRDRPGDAGDESDPAQRPRCTACRHGDAATAAPGGCAALRCGRDEVPGDCRSAGNSHRHGDVAYSAGTEGAASGARERPGNREGGTRMSEHLSDSVLNALADGELLPSQLAAANAHLADCSSCTSLALYRSLLKSATTKAGHRFEPPQQLQARLMGLAARENKGRRETYYIPKGSSHLATPRL